MARNVPRLETLDLDRFCNLVWYWATANAERADVEKLRAKVWMPPPSAPIPKNSPWSPESESQAFGSLKKALGK